MTQLGPLSLGRIQALPGDAVRALRLLPEIAESLRNVESHTSRLDEISASVEVLEEMNGRMAAIAEAMPDLIEVQRHLAELPQTMDRLDEGIARLSGLMEKIVVSLDGLNANVETLQEVVGPVGRLARKVPGQRKGT